MAGGDALCGVPTDPALRGRVANLFPGAVPLRTGDVNLRSLGETRHAVACGRILARSHGHHVYASVLGLRGARACRVGGVAPRIQNGGVWMRGAGAFRSRVPALVPVVERSLGGRHRAGRFPFLRLVQNSADDLSRSGGHGLLGIGAAARALLIRDCNKAPPPAPGAF